MGPVVAAIGQPLRLPMPSAGTWLALLGLALFGMAIACTVFFEILARAGASYVMRVTLLIHLSALLLGNVFLNKGIHILEILGATTIGLGLVFIDGRLPRRVARGISG